MLTDTQPGLETEMQDEPAGQPDLEATLQGLGMLPCKQTDQHEQRDVLQLVGRLQHTQPGPGTEHAVPELVMQEVAMLTDTQPGLETEMQDEPAGQPELEATLQGLGMLPCEQTDQPEQGDVLQLVGMLQHTQPGPGTELPSKQVGKPELEDALQGVDMLHHSQPGPETGVTCKQDGQPELDDALQGVDMLNITSPLLSSAKRMAEIPKLLDSPELQLGLLRGMTVFH